VTIRVLVPLLLAAALAGCAGNQTCTLPPSISLTVYKGPHGAPVVIGALGDTPAALVVDTGASTSTVSLSIAQQDGLAIEEIQGNLTLMGITGDVAAGVVTVPKFTLGSASATNAQFVVADVFGAHSPLDGVVGDDILKNYDIDLDLARHAAVLYPSVACATAALPWQGGAAAVPFHEDKAGRVFLNVVMAGKNVEALLDSGADVSSMPASLFDAMGLAASGRTLGQGAVSGISGQFVDAKVYRVSDMLVGNVKVAAPVLVVYGPLDYVDAPARERAHALARLGLGPDAQTDDNGTPYFLLGRDFISRHRLFISHSTNTLYIETGQAGG
jgi:predicted aspartyl protease